MYCRIIWHYFLTWFSNNQCHRLVADFVIFKRNIRYSDSWLSKYHVYLSLYQNCFYLFMFIIVDSKKCFTLNANAMWNENSSNLEVCYWWICLLSIEERVHGMIKATTKRRWMKSETYTLWLGIWNNTYHPLIFFPTQLHLVIWQMKPIQILSSYTLPI